MIFNLISLLSFSLNLVLSKFLIKYKHGNIILRILSIVIFTYKTIFYIVQNIKGQTSIPVEISSLSYFMVAIILTFKLTKAYHLASFFGISAGLGYFLFYIVAGFTVKDNFTISEFLIGNFSHGFLLISGLYLLKKNNFKQNNQLSIWVTILGMLVWALLFYDIEQPGITFIYYIIKPQYLFISNLLHINVLIMIAFYCVLISAFYFWVKSFYKINAKVNLKSASI